MAKNDREEFPVFPGQPERESFGKSRNKYPIVKTGVSWQNPEIPPQRGSPNQSFHHRHQQQCSTLLYVRYDSVVWCG